MPLLDAMHMRKNIQAFQLTRVKLPSRTLASKAPTKPNKTTFIIISMSVFNNIRCEAEEMPAQLGEDVPEHLDGNWLMNRTLKQTDT